MPDTLTIDVWSDVVCPFCYLGSHQLRRALDEFDFADQVVVRHHAFELDPASPAHFEHSLAELVAKKYGITVDEARQLHQRFETQGAEFGLTYSFDTARPTNTFDAHRLIALSARQGLDAAMSERLFRAYFSEGVLLSDQNELTRLALEVGVEGAAALWSGDDYATDVRNDEAQAHALGIRGVPAMIFNEELLVSGAQGVDALADALRQAWAQRVS